MFKYLKGFWRYLLRKRVSSLSLIDDLSTIHPTARVYSGCRIIQSDIGAYSYVGYGSILVNVAVGKFCSIAGDVEIGLATHRMDAISTSPLFYSSNNALGISWTSYSYFDDSHKPVSIGHDVWIGTRVVIMGGVKIGDGAVIGACAVVTRDIPPYAIV
ncbi:CatB-related O-acetyltransferase [Bacteroides fragilis]